MPQDLLEALRQNLTSDPNEGLSSPTPLDLLSRVFRHKAALGESPADAELNQQGSVMGSANRNEAEVRAQRSPLQNTISDLVSALNPLDWMGGSAGGSLAHVPQTFRKIGLERVGGTMLPDEYLAAVLAQPNAKRFLELAQGMVRRNPNLGESFPVFRGNQQTDPLLSALRQNLPELKPTAVTIDPGIADVFARAAAEGTRKPAFVAKGVATPESVMGLLPRRNTPNIFEQELIIDPMKLQQRPQLAAKVDIHSGTPFYTTPRTPEGGGEPIDDIMAALLGQ